MDTSQAALYPVAAVETNLYPSEEADGARASRGTGLEVSDQWAWSLVERGCRPHESRLS